MSETVKSYELVYVFFSSGWQKIVFNFVFFMCVSRKRNMKEDLERDSSTT